MRNHSRLRSANQLDQLATEFERELRAGRQTDLRQYLETVDAELRTTAFEELLSLKIEYSRQSGLSLDEAELLKHFPDQESVIRKLLSGRELASTLVSSQKDQDTGLGSDHGSGSSADPAGSESRFGDYELLEEIARGGMGVVYRARQVSLNRIVALKMILLGRLAADEEISRFKVEAEAAAGLDHPNIVPVYEIAEEHGQCFFSMGYVDGPSLANRVETSPLPAREAAEITAKVASALAFAHSRGVIHRDLKPGNVLLDAQGEPKVTDFGLAKQVQSDSGLTQTGAVMGTPAYMPPEQALGKVREVGPRADVYSLGAMLYCLLTGRPPFQAANTMETLKLVLEREPVSPRQLNPTLDRDLETICLKCLEKDPAQRFGSAEELADELRRFLRGEAIHARPTGALERSWRWCLRNRTIATLAAGFVFALLAGTIGSVTFAWRAIQSEELMRQEKDRADKAAESESAARRLAQQGEKKARAEAKRADENADRMRAALYASLTARARNLLVQRTEPGWSWEALSALEEACELRGADQDATELRSLYAGALDGIDVRPAATVAEDMDVSVIVWSPNGNYLAVGQRKHAAYCTVHLYDSTGRTQLKQLSFSTLSGTFGRLFRQPGGYQDGINSLAFSPDERWLVAGTRSGRLVRWDLTEETPEAVVWQGHQTNTNRVSFSADGMKLYSCGYSDEESSSHEIRLWSTEADWPQMKNSTATQLRNLCVARDGGNVAGVHDGRLTLAESMSLNPCVGWPRRVRASWCAFSSEGREIVGIYGAMLHLVARHSGTLVEEMTTPSGASIRYLSSSPDGSLLAVGDRDQGLHLMRVGGLPWPLTVNVPGRAEPIGSISPDGRTIAVAANRETQICELRGCSLNGIHRVIARHTTTPEAISLSADGRQVAVTARAPNWRRGAECQVASVWDVASGTIERESRFFGYPEDGWFPKNYAGDTVWVRTDDCVLWTPPFFPPTVLTGSAESTPFQDPAWDLSEGRIVLQEDAFECLANPQTCAVVDDHQASNGRALQISSAADATQVQLKPVPQHLDEHDYAVVITFKVRTEGSTGNALTLTAEWEDGSATSELEMFRVPAGEYHRLYAGRVSAGHTQGFRLKLANSQESSDLQTVLLDRCELVPLGIIDERSRQVQRSLYESLCLSGDGQTLWAVADDTSVVAWDRNTGRMTSRWDNSMARVVTGVDEIECLSVGSRWVAAGRRDGTTQLLNTADGMPLRLLPSLRSPVRSAAWSNEQTVIVAGAGNGVIGIFDPLTGKQRHSWNAHSASVEAMVWDESTDILISGSRDASIRFWRCSASSAELVLELADVGEVLDLQLSANGQTLAALVRDQRWVHIWHLNRLRAEFRRNNLDW